MMKISTYKWINKVVYMLCGSLILASMGACNRDFPAADNQLRTDYPNDTAGIEAQSRKVLYLILDGAKGTEVKTIQPVNIAKLSQDAVYTWNGISGYRAEDTLLAGAWTSMMTGVQTDKSKVVGSFDSANFAMYPSFVTRLKNNKPNLNITAYSASAMFSDNLLNGATVNKLFANDDQKVADGIIDQLKNEASDVVIGQFHGIETAGNSYGFDAGVAQYVDAVKKVDNYIGNILAALKSRPNYANEKWLVVVASNTNGINDTDTTGDFTAFGDSRKNSFVIYANPRLKPLYIPKPSSTKGFSMYSGSSLYLTGIGSSGVSIDINNNAGIYNIKKGEGATIAFKVKFLSGASGGYANLVGNRDVFAGSPGWGVWRSGDGSIILGFSDGGAVKIERNTGIKIQDNQWHTICFTVTWPTNEDIIHLNTYLDGVANLVDLHLNSTKTAINISRRTTIGSTSDLSYVDASANFMVSDFRYWNTPLPYNIVADYNCRLEIPTSSPYYGNLKADYRIDDASGSIIHDYSPNNINATVTDPSGIATWLSFSEISNAVCPPADDNYYKATINGIDIPFQIYQWLGVTIEPNWGLDGKYWSKGYNDVERPDNF